MHDILTGGRRASGRWPAARFKNTKRSEMASTHGCPNERQAVILAGGLGTRMRPITETIPKPMIAVAGEPFLQWQLKLLRGGGIANALLLVAYLGKQIEEYLGNGAETGACVEYSYERSPLGTGGALKNAEAK